MDHKYAQEGNQRADISVNVYAQALLKRGKERERDRKRKKKGLSEEGKN